MKMERVLFCLSRTDQWREGRWAEHSNATVCDWLSVAAVDLSPQSCGTPYGGSAGYVSAGISSVFCQ